MQHRSKKQKQRQNQKQQKQQKQKGKKTLRKKSKKNKQNSAENLASQVLSSSLGKREGSIWNSSHARLAGAASQPKRNKEQCYDQTQANIVSSSCDTPSQTPRSIGEVRVASASSQSKFSVRIAVYLAQGDSPPALYPILTFAGCGCWYALALKQSGLFFEYLGHNSRAHHSALIEMRKSEFQTAMHSSRCLEYQIERCMAHSSV